ncbi:MAG: cob(I)yrinic acid a,c-diamide adenosyltransferase [Candidatus Omnitrophota bacterium]
MRKSITTKTGDKGMTSLLGGRRVRKDHIIVRTCAQLDELCSFLGLAKSLLSEKACKKLLESIQKDLYVICSEVACQKNFARKLKRRIGRDHIKRLEDRICDLESRLKIKKCFTLPGENSVSALLDVARTECRSAEISIVILKNREFLHNGFIPIYVNRLSDLLYLLSRSLGDKSPR